MMIEDRASCGPRPGEAAVRLLRSAAAKDLRLAHVMSPVFSPRAQASAPNVNRTQAMTEGHSCRSSSRPSKRRSAASTSIPFSKYNQNVSGARAGRRAERYRSTADNLLSLRVPNGKRESAVLAGLASVVQQVSGPEHRDAL